MKPLVLLSCHSEEVSISLHPYFAARTKRGNPYKRRQHALRELISRGIKTYLMPVITRNIVLSAEERAK